jgi:hemoglobin-like flavoprotein
VLIASMAEIAGTAWTVEHEQAWTKAFGIVAGAMIQGAKSAQIEAAA